MNPSIAEVWRRLGGPPLRAGRGRAFWRNGDGYSVSVNGDRGQWYDFRDNVGGGIVRLVEVVLGVDRRGALHWLEREGFIEPRRTLTDAERVAWRRRRAQAEQAASELSNWREWAIRLLRTWRNAQWDLARSFERRYRATATDWEGRCGLIERSLQAERQGDAFAEALATIQKLPPATVIELRRHLDRHSEDRAA